MLYSVYGQNVARSYSFNMIFIKIAQNVERGIQVILYASFFIQIFWRKGIMKHRFLVAALASVMLASGTGAIVAPSHPVQAISKYSHRWHWVKVTKETPIYKVKVGRYMYQSKLTHKTYIEKGSDLKVMYPGHDYPWRVYAGQRGHWVALRQSANWFKNE